MNTFYFGQKPKKEAKGCWGRPQVPMKRVLTFDYSPDSLGIAMIGTLSKGQKDLSLVYAKRDTLKEENFAIKN